MAELITVHIGDQVHKVGLVTADDPQLVAMMVRDWADSFEEDPEDADALDVSEDRPGGRP